MDLTSFYSQFRDETVENLRTLNEGLVVLEGDLPDDERKALLDSVFRAMHTIKGGARMLGMEQVSRIAHTCEHILGAVREGRRSLSRGLTDELLRGGDAIQALVTATVDGQNPGINVEELTRTLGRNLSVDAPEETVVVPPITVTPVPAVMQDEPTSSAPVSTTSLRNARTALRQTIRVRVDRLDRLLNLAGEMKIGTQTEQNHLAALHDLTQIVRQQTHALIGLERELQRMRFSPAQRSAIDRHLNEALNLGEQANLSMQASLERYSQYASQSAQIIDDLEQEVMAVRLLPISTLFSNLPRAIRDLARAVNKEIALVLSGETTELDRKAIEALSDPLTHLLRNAVDHGIETPDEREQHGKSRQGTVSINARSMGTFVEITVSDDGRGMDPARLREAAVRKGLIHAEVAALLTEQESFELVFLAGFSTAGMITDISGRGVGMDVVRTNISDLGGQVQINSTLGQGTTITLVLPLTLVTTHVLLIEAGDQRFGLPATGCHGVLWIQPEQVRTLEGRAILPRPEGVTPLLRLDELLGIAHSRHVHTRRTPALLVGSATRPVAILVDRLLDEREVVVKPLGQLMEQQRRYTGAFQLGDGQLVLLLNPSTLAQLTRGMALAAPPKAEEVQSARRLLVADDSFATRELIRSILSGAGYDVTTAIDGLDALDKLQADSFDLVVSDVEMPRLDGFQLTSRIRSELNRPDLPVIIITSLASETHRRRGLEAGAQAYIVKSQFNQSNLVDTIRQLLGT